MDGAPPAALVARLRAICTALPEVVEEQAWAGTRWVVRRRMFAHAVMIEDGWPPVVARAAGTDGPSAVLALRCAPEDHEAFRHAGPPYFVPVWAPNVVGVVLEGVGAPAGGIDWAEVADLVVDSYCERAPKRLAARVVAARE